MNQSTELMKDPVESAKQAGLRYFHEKQLKIRRMKHGDTFQYLDADGDRVIDKEILERIEALVLPPAWTKVAVSPVANSHLQAIGFDEKGRKQYRYHEDWLKFRDETKFDKMVEFGKVLPRLRAQVDEDMAKHGLPREKVLATVVRLLEKTMIRVGNEQYAKENKSYGLTTLRNRHVSANTNQVHIEFKGKSGKFHDIHVEDRRLARLIRKLQELPGQDLFQYLDQDDDTHTVTSSDVNEYIQLVTNSEFTAKDFRTWKGTILAAVALADCEYCDSQSKNKSSVSGAVKEVAIQLGNTPKVCRKCYIHPLVIESFLEGNKITINTDESVEVETLTLLPEEKVVLKFLENTRSH